MKDYLDLFNQSYERVVQSNSNNKGFFERFYELFIPSSQEVTEKFKHTNMSHQQQMLQESVYHMVDFAATKQASGSLDKIAHLHSKNQKNIRPELYDLWLDNLLQAVREYDKYFSDDIELAWRVVLAPGIAYMKYYYDK